MEQMLWLIPGLPLLGFAILVLAGRRLGEPLAGWLATAMVGGSFAVSAAVFFAMLGRDPEQRVYEFTLFEWIPAGELSVDFGFLADPLSITMALFVTGVGALIHLYAIGYMHGDPNFSKFFLYLNLFVFSMLMLVLGDNLLVVFLGWEGVGACSYFLISFWFGEEANASAGKKAFVTNRVGDLGFMLAMFLLFFTVGSLNFGDIFASIEEVGMAESTATAIVLLLFVGAAGKSAQFPLYLWLPDAMAGPTPVSALIHAATMVTSGVYLLVRMNPVIAEAAAWSSDVIAWVGLFTALFAATIAVAQNDIKKVLAYSTVSQLGFMFVAVGTGLYVAAIFHMITHAFFKALLFLGAGSVIHGMHEEQDMRRYGALRKAMPITSATFIFGWLAISGVPPFSGFWSKDEVLLSAYNDNVVLWALLLIAAILTAFYMSRLVFMTFFGDARWNDPVPAVAGPGADIAVGHDTEHPEGVPAMVESAEHDGGHEAHQHEVHPHESPWLMWLPLVILAGLAAVAGFMQLPFSKDVHFLGIWLEPVLFENEVKVTVSGATKVVIALAAIAGGLVGIFAAAVVYLRRQVDARSVELPILARGWRYDETVTAFMGGPGRRFFELVAWFDRRIIDGVVTGTGRVTETVGTRLRATQTGLVRNYALTVVLGTVVLVTYFVTRTSF